MNTKSDTQNFFENVYNHSSINKENYTNIIDAHKKVEFKKNDIILKEGEISNAYYLIETGLFRSSVIDFKGNEITTEFFGQNQILIQVASLFLRTPSKETIQALTNGMVWKIEFDTFQALFNSIEGFSEWGRTWMSTQLFTSKQRALNILTQNATERYLSLIKEQQHIIKEVPLKYIATYLGITDTSLSRIRKELLIK